MSISRAVRLRECPLRELRLYLEISRGEPWQRTSKDIHVIEGFKGSLVELITYILKNILITLPCTHKSAFANKLNDRNLVCQYLSLLMLDSWTD